MIIFDENGKKYTRNIGLRPNYSPPDNGQAQQRFHCMFFTGNTSLAVTDGFAVAQQLQRGTETGLLKQQMAAFLGESEHGNALPAASGTATDTIATILPPYSNT